MNLENITAWFLPNLGYTILPLAFTTLVFSLSTQIVAESTSAPKVDASSTEEKPKDSRLKSLGTIVFVLILTIVMDEVLDQIYDNLYGILLYGGLAFVGIFNHMPAILKKSGYKDAQYNFKIPTLIICLWILSMKASMKYRWVIYNIMASFYGMATLQMIKVSNMRKITILLFVLYVYDLSVYLLYPNIYHTFGCHLNFGKPCYALISLEIILKIFHCPILMFPFKGKILDITGPSLVLQGFLAVYLRKYDLRVEEEDSPSQNTNRGWWKKSWSYHMALILGFAIGLELSLLTKSLGIFGKPSRIFITPCTLLPVIILAIKKGELSLLWKGWKEHTIGVIAQNIGNTIEKKELIESTGETKDEKVALPM